MSGLWARVIFVLWMGMTLITIVQPTLQFTVEMPTIHGIVTTALLIAAAF